MTLLLSFHLLRCCLFGWFPLYFIKYGDITVFRVIPQATYTLSWQHYLFHAFLHKPNQKPSVALFTTVKVVTWTIGKKPLRGKPNQTFHVLRAFIRKVALCRRCSAFTLRTSIVIFQPTFTKEVNKERRITQVTTIKTQTAQETCLWKPLPDIRFSWIWGSVIFQVNGISRNPSWFNAFMI